MSTGLITTWIWGVKHTWMPCLHKSTAIAQATLVILPRRSTWVVPLGMLFRTMAAARLLPSTTFIFSWGFLLTLTPPYPLSSSPYKTFDVLKERERERDNIMYWSIICEYVGCSIHMLLEVPYTKKKKKKKWKEI